MASLHPNSFEAWLRRHNGPPPREWRGSGRHADPVWVRLKTGLINAASSTTDRARRLSLVRNMTFAPSDRAMAPGHSHAKAAAMRRDASEFLSKVASALGERRYDVSVSSREMRGLAVGPRQYRVAKDLLSDSRQELLCSGDFVTMVDTDYYMDEAQISQYAGHDMGFYALRPDGLCGSTADSRWGFVDSQTVVEEVAGGATYRHKIWDWGKDLVVLSRGTKTYLYDPVLFPVSTSRVVVVLVLARVLHVPLFISRWLIPDLGAYMLTRMQVVEQGDFLLGEFGPAADRKIQIKAGRTLAEDSVTIGHNTFRALVVASAIPNTDRKVESYSLLPAAVERILRAAGERFGVHAPYVLSSYFTKAYKPFQLVNYQARGTSELEDGKPSVVLAAVPLAGAGCGPTSSHNNEARAIQARVVDVANKVQFEGDLITYGEEFARMVIPEANKGVPWEMAELREQQDRPTQRARRLEEDQFVSDTSAVLRTTSFQKRETYAKPGDPRLINQVPTDHTNRLCCYSGAVKAVLKTGRNSRWYMVGKTPLQIALGLRGLQRSVGGSLVGGDYSRMDGRTSVAYRRHVHRQVYMRYFATEYHQELDELLAKEESAVTRTRQFGVKAKMEGANLSGSGITTDLNTLDAAFNEYAARRRMGQAPQQAFNSLGCYFGDDSVVDARVFDEVVKVATSTGMKLEAEPVPSGVSAGYVVFLSRVYPDIATSLASHPSIVRSLRKLCTVTAGPGASKKELALKLRLKVEGSKITDSHVPVLREYLGALERVYKLADVKATRREMAAAEKQDASYRHKKAVGPYPTAPGDEDVLLPSVARELGISVEEACLLVSKLNEVNTESDLAALAMPAEVELPAWARWVPTDMAAI